MVLTGTEYNIYFGASGLICIIAIAALGIAMQKKHYKAMGLIAFAVLISFFLPSWIALLVSLGYLIVSAIWFKSEKKAIVTKIASKEKSEKKEEADDDDLVKCRFCKKLYSAEYNGCPYCKKK